MPTSFDLSNQGSQPGQPGQSQPRQEVPRGTGTVMDDYARYVVWIALVAFALALAYLCWGLFSASWCNPAYEGLDHLGRLKQLNNIILFSKILTISSWLGVLALLIFSFRDEAVGYILLTIAAFFYLGIPYLYSQIVNGSEHHPSPATDLVLGNLQAIVFPFGIPGVGLVIVDIIRKMQDAADNAAVQRANVRYGANVAEQKPTSQQRQVFLGSCWQLSYCRDNVRVKCPIFLEKKGPCWWRKRGCMCDERIVLQAVISSDWKEQTHKADSNLKGGGVGEVNYQLTAAAAPVLSDAAKRERCRGCIIYNEHQRQKYKAIVTVVLVAVVALCVFGNELMKAAADKLVYGALNLAKQLSFGDPSAAATTAHPAEFVEWCIIACVALVILAQILKFIEYCCFKIKI